MRLRTAYDEEIAVQSILTLRAVVFNDSYYNIVHGRPPAVRSWQHAIRMSE
jgi:hypothetical protein